MENWIKNSTTSLRLQEIMKLREMKQADLARKTGISRGAISNYVLGRYEPKSDIINTLAMVLNCSEMWLWGYDVPMQRNDNAVSSIMVELTPGEKMLLDMFKQIPESKQETVLRMIELALNVQ